MHLSASFDPEASAISDKLTFFCDKFELHREDIADFKKKKLVRLVDADSLPETIPCQVLVQCENATRAKMTFFNPNFLLPQEVYDDPLLNKDLIEASERNGGFWLEIHIPLKDSGIGLNFSYEN